MTEFPKWHEKYPQLFEQEREALEKQGFSLDSEVFSASGKVEFVGTLPAGGVSYYLRIRYPYGYPDFPPDALCLDVENGRHQQTNTGKLCLLEDWKDSGVVRADEILGRAAQWFEMQETGFDPDEEIDGPEPRQYFVNTPLRSIVFAPSEVFADWTAKEGTFKAKLGLLSTKSNGQGDLVRGLLSELHSNPNTWRAEERYEMLVPNYSTFVGKCFNVDEAPPYFKKQDELIAWLESKGHNDVFRKCEKAGVHLQHPNNWLGPLLGVRYPDEVGRRGNIERRFLLVSLMKFVAVPRQKPRRTSFAIFETKEFSEDKMFSRVANLNLLREKRVVALGLGTIGSSIAVELAKAGVGRLTVVDPDFVDTGNVIRSAYSLHQIGFTKAHALKQTILSHNPYTEVVPRVEYWGCGDTGDQEIADCVAEADLVLCAVGHTPTERYVGRITSALGKPSIFAYSSMGAWSGRAFRVVPGRTGCYDCHGHGIKDETLPKMAEPDSVSAIYDHGCAIPAFPGSGIDTGAVANIAARLAIQTLLSDDPTAYEPTDADHIVWYGQGKEGRLLIEQKAVSKHEKCEACSIGN